MIDQAAAMKQARAGRPKGAADDAQPLAGHMVALIFEKPSTRTRVSFDVGVRQMGGQSMVLSGSEMQLGHGETIADTARVLSRYVDLIMIRTFEEDVLLELAENATVPVINGLTNRTHPCQIMADILTYEEHRGPIAGKKVVWSGDGNNVCASMIHAAGQFGFDLTFTGPETLDPERVFIEEARAKGSKIEIVRDPARAVEGADLVVVTSDNPRREDPERIIEEIRAGCEGKEEKVRVVVERGRAIELALAEAGEGDIVLIAGKGHETTQTVAGESRPFDDRVVAAEVLAGLQETSELVMPDPLDLADAPSITGGLDLPALDVLDTAGADPAADDPDAIYRNNAEASYVALGRGASGEPTATEINQALPPSNPFFTAPE